MCTQKSTNCPAIKISETPLGVAIVPFAKIIKWQVHKFLSKFIPACYCKNTIGEYKIGMNQEETYPCAEVVRSALRLSKR